MVQGQRLLPTIDHAKQHKGQLFYYLRLQGKSVNTGNLWVAWAVAPGLISSRATI